AWPSARMAGASPALLMTRPCGCGTWGPARRPWCSRNTSRASTAWLSARTGSAWPVFLSMGQYGCGGAAPRPRGAAPPARQEDRLAREAVALVEPLFFQLLTREDVLDRLRSDARLREPLRQEALKRAECYSLNPEGLNEVSWAVVAHPGQTEADYRHALRLAE